MAQRVVTQMVSDISGVDIEEGSGQTIEFAYRGVTYRIDLTNQEANEFDQAIAQFVENATRAGGRRKAAVFAAKSGYVAKDVRAWALANGLDVPQRGRIPSEILERYQREH
ncbi:histone-like nucleoid-structuring protein Lsr2 [Nocardioides sp. Bht2]|uniref:histone-like nucleoid-structuring protein Lsr2 n=1 Tax=Nocardioides sp. Bht2 TaxID=3392297 RepID=UPI0039B3A09B